MEKIITVKQEPVDENYTGAGAANLVGGAVQIVSSRPGSITTSSAGSQDAPIILVPAKNETAVTQAQCSFAASTQAASSITPKRLATNQTSPQLVVISAGSPIKITPISIKTSGTRGSMQAGPSANVTFVQVQPISATGKQPIVPRAAGSPSKQTIQLQKVVPITVASSQTKSQSSGTVQFTVASTTTAPVTTAVRQIAPKVIAPMQTGNQVIQGATAVQVQQPKPLQVQQQLAPKPVQLQGTVGQQPRVIVPAIAPNLSTSSTGLQFPHGLISGGVVYLPQQALSTAGAFPIAVPLSANAFTPSSGEQAVSVNGNAQEVSPPNRPRKPCNCTKSQCLKLYCDCFANGEFCSNCNCVTCFNNMEHEKERSKAIKACLERNPQAFHPKIGKGKVGESERRHNKGCHCKRSGCLKNYCECYEAKILCTSLCKCTGCKNFEESPERKTLMHLADAAEVRVKQQHAAKTKLESQIEDLPSRSHLSSTGERLPFSFVTEDVVNATCQCLFAQAIEAEKSNKSTELAERMVLEEFGRCLLQIIHTANKTKGES